MKTFYSEMPTGKFIALFSDGSGGCLYMSLDGENGKVIYCNHEGDIVPDQETYFGDAGYDGWLPLPDDFKLWFEQVPV